MKKISLFIVAILLIIPLSVRAAGEYKVSELTATADGTTIKYDGTMENGSTAVKCWLYEGTTELLYFSSAVDNNKFNGTFTAPKSGEYIVKCANYEGGDLKEATVTVEDVTTATSAVDETETKTEETKDEKTSSTSKNPKTNDNVLKFVALMIISLLGASLIIIKLKKEVK